MPKYGKYRYPLQYIEHTLCHPEAVSKQRHLYRYQCHFVWLPLLLSYELRRRSLRDRPSSLYVRHLPESGLVSLAVICTSSLALYPLTGTCVETSNSTFTCTCPSNWQGPRCERPVNYCFNVTCLNSGVCRSSSLNYTCECLGDSYSGRHCEIRGSKLQVHQAVSRSFAYVAIAALASAGLFIVAMDVLKYGFGIDPVRKDRQRMQKKTAKRQTAIRFMYVNAPMDQDSTTLIDVVF